MFKKKNIILLMVMICLILFFLFSINIKSSEQELNHLNLFVIDSDSNDFPDILQLSSKDSRIFQYWFNNIILNIANDYMYLPDSYQDCAGLIRYAYKEALKPHDQNWLQKTGFRGKIIEDVSKYNYPNIPFYETKIFKISENGIEPDSFSDYATARYLIEFNMKYLSKDLKTAENGDILAFFHPEDPEFPYHLMVYYKDPNTNEAFAIYHTGPINEHNNGELRVVKIENLHKADPTWMATIENRNFMGIYRFKILSY